MFIVICSLWVAFGFWLVLANSLLVFGNFSSLRLVFWRSGWYLGSVWWLYVV